MTRKRSATQLIAYRLLRHTARLAAVIFWRIQCLGRHHIPRTGPALICANHQSVLDPILVGMQFNRRLNYLARRSLFENRILASLIRFLDAIPIEREGMGLDGLRETLRRLHAGELVLIFPEGTRSPDGRLQPLKPGFCAVAKRAEVPLLPVAIDGAHCSWPRYQPWPHPARIVLVIGPCIEAEQVRRWAADQLVQELQQRLAACHQQARSIRLGLPYCGGNAPVDHHPKTLRYGSVDSPAHFTNCPTWHGTQY
ncbi:MAG: hypothetical protein KatS3mg110_1965 [Pirellulaceae bacterium]|nr:MAG: hypothetical protein KatS3mg110_1965 [Pirellulaceae bacterium]